MVGGDAIPGDVRTVAVDSGDGTNGGWAETLETAVDTADGDVFDFTGTDGVETENATDAELASGARTTVDGNGTEEGLGTIVSC